MKMYIKVIILMFLALIIGCGKREVNLNNIDREIAKSIAMPENFLLQIKKSGGNIRYLEGKYDEGTPSKAKGVTIDVSYRDAAIVVNKLQKSAPPGWLCFVSDRNFGIEGSPDHVSVLKADNLFEVIRVIGTNGWNYDIGPEKVISQLKDWDEKYGLVLQGAGFDWFEASFKKQPKDMLKFAKEVNKFCPDLVAQGSGNVESLAKEMKQTNTLYLWWD